MFFTFYLCIYVSMYLYVSMFRVGCTPWCKHPLQLPRLSGWWAALGSDCHRDCHCHRDLFHLFYGIKESIIIIYYKIKGPVLVCCLRECINHNFHFIYIFIWSFLSLLLAFYRMLLWIMNCVTNKFSDLTLQLCPCLEHCLCSMFAWNWTPKCLKY